MTRDPSAPVTVGGHAIPRDVLDGIRAASRRTGVSFKFLLAEAQRESTFRPGARHAVTSASGLYQFTQQTWLELVKKHGTGLGLADQAARIQRTPNGNYVVDDPGARAAILDLRRNHGLSSAFAAEFARDNRLFLEKTLGHPVGEQDLYLAHLLGPGGAARLLKARDANPDQSAAAVLPQAARTNRTIFHDEDTGAPRSVAEVTRLLGTAIDRSMRQFAQVSPHPDARPPLPSRRPAEMEAPPASAPPPVLVAEAPSPPAASSAAAYTLLARAPMPPLPSSTDEQPTTVTVASLPMPPLVNPGTVTGPGPTEKMLDLIFRSLFSRSTT
ncbi:MAG: transglycosylase SLT domain-containing protein [Alphaproteobacteria bacterium]